MKTRYFVPRRFDVNWNAPPLNWRNCLLEVYRQFHCSAQVFQTWFARAWFASRDSTIITWSVPTRSVATAAKLSHYKREAEPALCKIKGMTKPAESAHTNYFLPEQQPWAPLGKFGGRSVSSISCGCRCHYRWFSLLHNEKINRKLFSC